jgi:hypothetical protein
VDTLEGRPYEAVRILDQLAEAYPDTETAATARERAKAIREDEEVQPVLRAHEALAKARREARDLPLRERVALFRRLFETAEDPAVRDRARVHVSDLETEIRRTGGTP